MAGVAAQQHVSEPAGGGGLYGAMFFPIAAGAPLSVVTYERQAQIWHRTPGTFSRLGVYVTVNEDLGPTHFMLMFNTGLGPALGANGDTGAMDALAPGLTTGFFEDVEEADRIDGGIFVTGYRLRTSGTSLLGLKFSHVQWQFVSDTDDERCYRLGIINDSNLDNYADVKMGCAGGWFNGGEQAYTDDLTSQLYTPPSGALARNACIKSWSNSANDDTILTFRKNGANTALAVTMPQETSGVYENLDDEVTLVEGDLFNWRIQHGPDFGGSYTHETAAVDIVTPDWFGGSTKNNAGNTIHLNDDTVAPLEGNHEAAGDEAAIQWHAETDEEWRGIVVMIPTNGMLNGAVYWRTRINGVDGDQEVTVPFGQTGVFISAGATPDPFVSGDLLSLHRVAVSSSSPGLIYHTHSFFGGPVVPSVSVSDSSTPTPSDSSEPPIVVPDECIVAPPTVGCINPAVPIAGCVAAQTTPEAGCAEAHDASKMTVRLNG